MNEEQATAEEVAEAVNAEAAIAEGIEKKERQIFKGEKVAIKDMTKYLLRAVQILDPKVIPKDYNGRIPGTVFVSAITPGYDRNSRFIRIMEPRAGYRERIFQVKDDLELNVLTGTVGDKYNQDYTKWARANLGRTVQHPYVTMGCDPEIFVVEKDNPEKIIPAWKFLGSKKEPDYTPTGVGYGDMPMYWDGFQAEFTTRGGITCLGYVFDSVHSGLKGVYQKAKKYDKDAVLSIKSVLPVDPEILATGEEQHVQFGCMPSYNAYGLSGLPNDGRTCPIRFAGGHIHFGMAPEHKALLKSPEALKKIIWHLDAIAGVACVSLFENWDNPVRRQYYGLPGEYRLPPHGLEYRTLSNAWLAHPLIGNLTMEVARRAYAIGIQGPHDAWEATEGEVLDCILRHDAEVARAILKRNKDVFKALMSVRPGGDTELLYTVFSRDMSETIKDPTDLEKNWHLKSGWIGHTGNAGSTWASSMVTISKGGKV